MPSEQQYSINSGRTENKGSFQASGTWLVSHLTQKKSLENFTLPTRAEGW